MIRFFILFLVMGSSHVFSNHSDEYKIIQEVDLKCFLLAQKAMKKIIKTEGLEELDSTNYFMKNFEKINCFHYDENIVIQFQYPVIPDRDWKIIVDRKSYSYQFDSESFEVLNFKKGGQYEPPQ